MLDYEFNMGYEQNSKLHVNIYEFKLCIITEKSIITELKKYYTQFVVSNFDSTDLTYYFIIDKMDNLSDKFKKLPGVIEKWSNIFILDEEPKIKCFLIPNKGYPVVLINQIINNFTHDMLTINNIIPFHAGAVSKNKNALLLIGEQRSGKTTLSLSLTNNGYEYFTDDIALIDLKTNEVLPYFAGITPRINTVKMFPELIQNEYSHPYLDFDDNEQRWCIELANLFADKMSKPCKLKYIIFPKFKPDCEFSIKSMDRSTAIVMMMRNMKMIPTLVLGSSSIKTMSKILKNDVDTYYMEYPNRYVAMEFIDTLYKE